MPAETNTLGKYIPQFEPCPFDGETPTIFGVRDPHESANYEAFVECYECGIIMTSRSEHWNPYRWPIERRHEYKSFESVETTLLHELVTQWNTRHK